MWLESYTTLNSFHTVTLSLAIRRGDRHTAAIMSPLLVIRTSPVAIVSITLKWMKASPQQGLRDRVSWGTCADRWELINGPVCLSLMPPPPWEEAVTDDASDCRDRGRMAKRAEHRGML